MSSHGLHRHPYAVIDLEALRHNYRHLQKIAGGNRLIAVVKADAYGHGAVAVARALADADAFAVAAVGEAASLREAGIEQKILVMGGFTTAVELQTCIGLSIDPVIHHRFHLDALRSGGDLNDLDVWVKIDSGMGRLGFNTETTHDVLDFLRKLDTLGNIRLMTHLANADDVTSDFTEAQLARVRALELDGYEWGIANSAGILGWPDTHRLWARTGLALYGADPLSDRRDAQRELRPVMTMKSVVLAVNPHACGDLIGYGNAFICPRDMTIAVVATGYADGYPRHKVDSARVEIKGVICNVVGRVSMDMITVDVSGLQDVNVGDEVTLFGNSPNVAELADCSETIAYEILCNVGAHVRREYIG
ncbi:MAG: alanine racemase [Gammaproteobacteria bacterium]|nr:alanine racemase [Gammaproteobacteria bacterium]MDH3535007.1 alanine racemase [Gammaproteobacteria bacterium]